MNKFCLYIKFIFKVLLCGFIFAIFPDVIFFKYSLSKRSDCIILSIGTVFCAICLFFQHRCATKKIIIDDKDYFIKNLKETLPKVKWKLIKIENDIIFINPGFVDTFLGGRIIIKIYENNAEIIGPKCLVEDFIWDLENL